MTREEAMQVLLLYRPGTDDSQDPEIATALALARTDPELSGWLEKHCAFQEQMRTALRGIEVPPGSAEEILARRNVVRRPEPRAASWRWILPWAAAAAAVIIIAIVFAGGSLQPKRANTFANLELRMVSSALREYRMDILTNDVGEVRQYLKSRGAPANFEITQGLSRLEPTGGGLLRWRGNPVSMVCFNRGDNEMLFLFVVKRAALKDPPSAVPRVHTVRDLATAHWTRGDNVYILAGPDETNFAKRYL
jgi:hypothetical protein